MEKNELINVIDECLCHFKNGTIAYTRKDLINKIINAVDLYHDSEVKKIKRKITYDKTLCTILGHKPNYDLLIDNRLKGIDETHCERCGRTFNTKYVIKHNWNKFYKRLQIRLIESLNNSPYKEMLRPEYRKYDI